MTLKTKTILLLTGTMLCSFRPLELRAMDDENQSKAVPLPKKNISPQEFQEKLQKTRAAIEKTVEQYKGLDKVIIIGPTDSGKSTIINYLAKEDEPLLVTKEGKLDTKNPLEGSAIGRGNNSTTRFPSSWKDSNNNIVYWDCPGDEDTAGSGQEIINIYTRNALLQGNFKILLTLPEASLDVAKKAPFIKAINKITKILPVERLKESVALIITKQEMYKWQKPHDEIGLLLKDGAEMLEPDGKALLEHLFARKEKRIPYFPAPQPGTVIYDLTKPRENIFEALKAISFMENPPVKIHHSPESLLFIEDLARDLNEKITQELTTLGKKLIESSAHQINAFANQTIEKDNLTTLQANIGSLKLARSLLNEGSLENFASFAQPADRLLDFLNNQNDSNTITEYAKTLVFLQTLTKVTCDKDIWKSTLDGITKKINEDINKRAVDLKHKISAFVEIIGEKSMVNDLFKIEKSDDNEQNIKDLTEHLNRLNQAVAILNMPENPESFIELLGNFYGKAKDDINQNMNAVKAFIILKNLYPEISDPQNPGIPDPRPGWSNQLVSAKDKVNAAIESQRKQLKVKQELRKERQDSERDKKQHLEELTKIRAHLEADKKQRENEQQRQAEEKRQQQQRDEQQKKKERKEREDEQAASKQREEIDKKQREEAQEKAEAQKKETKKEMDKLRREIIRNKPAWEPLTKEEYDLSLPDERLRKREGEYYTFGKSVDNYLTPKAVVNAVRLIGKEIGKAINW